MTVPLFATRLGLILAFVVLVGTTVAAVAPRQMALLAAMLTVEGGVLALWLLAAYGLGEAILRLSGTGIPARVGRRPSASPPAGMPVPPDDDATLAVITRVAVGLGALSLLTLALGVAGLLTQPVAVGVVLLGDALAVVRICKGRHTTAAWLADRAGAAWLLLLVAPVVALVAVAGCVLPGLLWGLDDPSGYDVVAYHLQLPREWHDAGRIATLRHNVFSFFPLNVEMHSLLALHLRGGPVAGMHLAQLMHGAFVLLTVAAVYGAARRRGRLAASVAAVACAGVPWTAMLGGVAFNEGGLMLFATLAAAWAIRGRWALAGACAGFAAGCKLTGVAAAVVLVPLAVALADLLSGRATRPGEGAVARRPLVIGIAAFAFLALLTVAPWLVRTALASGGNPVFPLAARTLGAARFDAGQVERFEVAHVPRADQQSVGGRLAALWQQVGGDYHYGSIVLGHTDAGTVIALPLWLALIVPAIVLARRDREAWVWLGLIVGNVAVWLVATHLQGRFLVQIVPCVALLVACAVGPRGDGSRDDGAQGDGATPRWRFAAIAVLVVVASFAFAMRRPLSTLLAAPGPLDAVGLARPEELRDLLPADVARAVYDTDRVVVLVGDAKAFWYAVPSSRLRYRSVFDVAASGSFRDAWLGGHLGDGVPADALVVVDPGELARFARTYRHLPPVPPAWRDRTEPFVVRAADVPE